MVVSALAFALLGRVGTLPFVRAVGTADVIVTGQVDHIVWFEGHRFANLRIERTLKGVADPNLWFLAESTWACDGSGATSGESGTFLLYRIDAKRHWIDGNLTRPGAIRRAAESAPVYSLGRVGEGRIVEGREERPGKLGKCWIYGGFIMPHAVPPQFDASGRPFYSRDRIAIAVAFCLRGTKG